MEIYQVNFQILFASISNDINWISIERQFKLSVEKLYELLSCSSYIFETIREKRKLCENWLKVQKKRVSFPIPKHSFDWLEVNSKVSHKTIVVKL